MNSLKSDFTKYVSLNVAGMVGMSCYILADTFFVAKAMGAAGLAALNFSIAVFSLMQGFGLMLGMGGATDFSIHKQERDNDDDHSFFVHALVLGGAVSLLFLLIAAFFTAPLGRLLGADEITLPLTRAYLTVVLSFAPFFTLNHILLAFVRNDKNPRLSMVAMLVSSFANIVLDYFFMFPLSMGMAGAALATGLSPIISLCILSAHFIRKRNSFHLRRCALRLKTALRVMSLGVSSLIGELASAISLIVFNLIILGLAGNTGVAAYGVVANIALIATAIFVGVSQGIQPLVSKYYARGDALAVRFLLRRALCLSLLIFAALYLTVFFFAGPIASVFNSEGNAQLAALAVDGLRLYFPGYLFAGLNIISAAFLSATASAAKGTLVALFRSCAILVPLVLLLSALFGMSGVWLAFPATELAVFCCSATFLARSRHAEPPLIS